MKTHEHRNKMVLKKVAMERREARAASRWEGCKARIRHVAGSMMRTQRAEEIDRMVEGVIKRYLRGAKR